MKPLRAPRAICPPNVDTFPFQDLVIADESGTYSDAPTIAIQCASAGTGAWFRRGAANLWIRR